MRRTLSAFAILVIAGHTAATLAAQQSPPAPGRLPTVVSYEQIRKKALSMAGLMPEHGYNNQTAAEARTFAEVVGHTVDTNFGICASVRKVDNPRKDKPAEAVVGDKTALVALLTDSFTFCEPAFAALTAATVAESNLVFLLTHTSEMLGIMGGYLRAEGLAMTNAEVDRQKKQADRLY